MRRACPSFLFFSLRPYSFPFRQKPKQFIFCFTLSDHLLGKPELTVVISFKFISLVYFSCVDIRRKKKEEASFFYIFFIFVRYVQSHSTDSLVHSLSFSLRVNNQIYASQDRNKTMSQILFLNQYEMRFNNINRYTNFHSHVKEKKTK